MFVRLPKLLLALALATTIGWHWAFLQAVAWAGMIVVYAQDAPLGKAVAKTFDGRHPCKLCKEIATSKQSEKRAEHKFQFGKREFLYASVLFVFQAPCWFRELRAGNDWFEGLARPPALPPPRPQIG